jgi:Protein of unknown function (DUF4013)
MNVRDVFSDSLHYPITDIRRLLILFLLLAGSFLILPGIYAYGYFIKIIKSSINGSESLPDFTGRKTILIDGLKFIAVSIIYGIPTFLVFPPSILLIYSSAGNLISEPLPTLILIIIVFLVNILFFIGLANMAYHDRFTAAFNLKEILKMIKIIGWEYYLLMLLLVTIITQLLNLVSLLLTNPVTYGIFGSDLYIKLIGALIISSIFNVYLFTFESRLRGLIYTKGIVEPVPTDESIKDESTKNESTSEINQTHFITVHPVVSIIIGLFVFLILPNFAIPLYNIIGGGLGMDVIFSLLGGFVATYLTKEKKIYYAIILGICIAIVIYLLNLRLPNNSIYDITTPILLILLFTVLGGFIGKMTDKKNRLYLKNIFNSF